MYVAEDAPTGYGDAGDRMVRALRESGITVEYRGVTEWRRVSEQRDTGVLPALIRHSRDDCAEDRAPRDAPTVAHLVPEHYPVLRELRRDGPLIGHTVWETDRVPAHWPPLLNGVDGIVVPTEWNREVFRACGVTTPISVVPHVACEPVPGDDGIQLGLPDDVVVFYTISRWDERKAPWVTLRGFLEAFSADDPVALVVKTGQGQVGDRFPAIAVARLFGEYSRPPRVQFEVGDWTDDRVAGLHARGDCFISLTHGEGWGIGAFDACAYGNPVVITGWGGQLEYLDADAGFLVDYDLVPVRHGASSYTSDQHWAEPRLDHAVELLRAVAADPVAARRRAATMLPRMRNEFAGPAVARRLTAAVWGP